MTTQPYRIEQELDTLRRCIAIVKEYPADEEIADVMLPLATKLYREADIGIDEYANVLRLYADWLQSTDWPKGRRHAV